MTTRYCTLFDANYASRGLTMLESLQRLAGTCEIIVLALDDRARDIVGTLGRPDWKVVSVADLGDADLMAVRQHRPHREFCWTCTPALLHAMVSSAQDGDTVCYADADMMFFTSPQVLLDELGTDGSILIHEHRYAPEKAHELPSSGRFNVGFVAFRVGDEARRCTARWRAQTLETCVLDPARGLCGDQGYLDEWPDLYPGLRVMRNIGGGVAPWNVNNYVVDAGACGPMVDNVDVVFYHYHAFKFIADRRLGRIAAVPAPGYVFPRQTLRQLYRPYLWAIRDTVARTRALIGPRTENPLPRRDTLKGVLTGQIMIA